MTTQQTFAFMEFTTPFVKPMLKTRVVKTPVAKTSAVNSPVLRQEQSSARVAKTAREQEKPNETLDRQTILDQLRMKAGCVTASSSQKHPQLSTGCSAIDHELLQGGLRVDAVSEWIADTDSSGAAALSMVVAASCLNLNRAAGPIVIVDTNHSFFPPAAISLGIPADRMILVRPHCQRDSVWAIDQALRCEAVAAVWSIVRSKLNDRDARRFQLAAEEGRTTGLFVRPSSVRGQANFADVRLHVKRVAAESNTSSQTGLPSARFGTPLEVTLDRGRGHQRGKSVFVQIDDQARLQQVTAPQTIDTVQEHLYETATMHLASQLAHPKSSAAKASTNRKRA